MIQKFTVFLLEGWTVRGKGRSSKTGNKEIVVRDENNFGKGGSSEEGKKWSESNYVRSRASRLLDGLKMGCEWKRGIMGDFGFVA